MIASLCLFSLALAQRAASELPAWLQVNQPTLDKMYGRGISDAGRGVRPAALVDMTRRNLGQIDPTFIRDESDSHIWEVDPFVQAYQFGWKARHDDWSPEQVRDAHDQLVAWGTQGRKRLTFQVVLNVLRNSPAGPLTHPATPEIFRDLQVQLKIGGRRYEPEHQPGDLVFFAGQGSITAPGSKVIPTPVPGVPDGPGELSTGGAKVTNYFTVYRTLKYEFYQGNFTVVFDLYNSDGTPRVTAKDNAISPVIITTGGNEHQATYAWNEFMAIRSGG